MKHPNVNDLLLSDHRLSTNNGHDETMPGVFDHIPPSVSVDYGNNHPFDRQHTRRQQEKHKQQQRQQQQQDLRRMRREDYPDLPSQSIPMDDDNARLQIDYTYNIEPIVDDGNEEDADDTSGAPYSQQDYEPIRIRYLFDPILSSNRDDPLSNAHIEMLKEVVRNDTVARSVTDDTNDDHDVCMFVCL